MAVAVFLGWQTLGGGFPPSVWYPGALFLLALLVVAGATFRDLFAGVRRPSALALAFLAGFTAWSFLSIAWADVRGEAWDGANRTLLYLTVYAFFALWPWRSRQAAFLLGLFAVGTAAIGGIALVRASLSSAPAEFFIDTRLAEPTGYVNATAGLFLIAFWPALFLASRREVAVPLRAASLAAAGVLLELALLPQSRGSLFAFPVVLVLFFALVPGRVRSAVFLAPAAIAAALAARPLLDVYSRGIEGELGPALEDGRNAVLVSAGALLVVGIALALADRSLRLPDRSAQRVRAAVGVTLLALALAGVAAGLWVAGDPRTRAADAWDEFKAGQAAEFGASHLVGGELGSNRYDYWRVALAEFRAAPLQGMGADNFAVAYVRERRSDEEPRYPHSLQVQILSQTGLVGAALFGGFLVSALVAAWSGGRHRSPFGKAVAGASVITFAYWFVHGSVDWFWEFPALAAPALACLGMAAGLGKPLPLPPAPSLDRRALRLLAVVAAAALAAAALASYAPPWLSERDAAQAAAVWRDDPAEAFERLERARRLNPLSDRPDLVAGAIAMRLGDLGRAERSFSGALERNPQNWYAYLELAVIDALRGREARALEYLAEAASLNPREGAVDLVRGRIEEGEPLDPREVDRLFLERLERRTT